MIEFSTWTRFDPIHDHTHKYYHVELRFIGQPEEAPQAMIDVAEWMNEIEAKLLVTCTPVFFMPEDKISNTFMEKRANEEQSSRDFLNNPSLNKSYFECILHEPVRLMSEIFGTPRMGLFDNYPNPHTMGQSEVYTLDGRERPKLNTNTFQ